MMCKKLIYVLSFIFILDQVQTNGARGELVGSRRLDERSGTIANNSSGCERNGSFQGDPQWVAGKIGFALEFDGDDYVEAPNAAEINPASITMATWVDGFGIADNGAQVGYLMPPYAEQAIVHGAAQSMPLMYINEAGVTNSEASLTLTSPRDWTRAGVEELSLWTRGRSANAADPLYVAISNAVGAPAIVAHDDPSAATKSAWKELRISLQAFADQRINLTEVDMLAIGLGSKGGAAVGGTGTMYIDDIRLYRP